MATLQFGNASFGPEEVRMMAGAFDAAWKSLTNSGVMLSEHQTHVVRALLAECVVEMASKCERDQDLLRDASLARLGVVSLESVPRRFQ